mgnify:CR=1 FL=1
MFAGALTQNSFIHSLYSIDPKWTSSYIAGIDLSYRFYRFHRLPVDLELDVTVAKRFGDDRQWDVGAIPMLRWREFPWNDLLYTNFRIGLLGASYVTGVSPWELHWAGNTHGSRYLNYLSVELDFKPSRGSDLEGFIRLHHRSGIFGLVNDTHGGSTYMTTGVRWPF